MKNSPYQPRPSHWLAYQPTFRDFRRPLRDIPLLGGNKYFARNFGNSQTIASKLKDFEFQIECAYSRQRIESIRNRRKPCTPPPPTAEMLIADRTHTRLRNAKKSKSTNDYKPLTTNTLPYISRQFLDKGNGRTCDRFSSATNNKEKNSTLTSTTRPASMSSSLTQRVNTFGTTLPKQVKKKSKPPRNINRLPPQSASQSQQQQSKSTNGPVAATIQNSGIVPLSPQRYLTHRPSSSKPRVSLSKLKVRSSNGGISVGKSHTETELQIGQVHTQMQLPIRKTKPKLLKLTRSGRLNVCSAKSMNIREKPKIVHPSSDVIPIVLPEEYSVDPLIPKLPLLTPTIKGKYKTQLIHDPYSRPVPVSVPDVNSVSNSSITGTNSALSLWNFENDPRPSFEDFKKGLCPEISDFTDLECDDAPSELVNRMSNNKSGEREHEIFKITSNNTGAESFDNNTETNKGDTVTHKIKSKGKQHKLKSKLKSVRTPLALVRSGVFEYLKRERATTADSCYGATDSVDPAAASNNTTLLARPKHRKNKGPRISANIRKVSSNPSLQKQQTIIPIPANSQLNSNSVNNSKVKKSRKTVVNTPCADTKTTGTGGQSTATNSATTTTTTAGIGNAPLKAVGVADNATVTATDTSCLTVPEKTGSLSESAPPKLKGILKPTKHKRAAANKITKDINNNDTVNGYSALASLGVCTAQPGTSEWMAYWEKYDQAIAAYKQSEAVYARENQEYQHDIEKYTKEAARLALEEAMFRQSIGLDPKTTQEIIEKPIKGLTTLNGFVFDRNANGPAAFLSTCGKKGFRLEIDVRGMDPDDINIETEFNLMKILIPMKPMLEGKQKTLVKSIVIGVPNEFNLGDLEIYPIVKGWLVVEAPDMKQTFS